MHTEDPRIEELMERLNDKGPDGAPTRAAQFAQKIKGYLFEIAELRAGLDQAAKDLTDMESRSASMESQMKERDSLRADLVYEAQDAAVRAAMSGSSGGAATLLKQVQEKRQKLADFDAHYSGEKTRYERLLASVSTKGTILRKNRDLIALRLNTISALLARTSQMEQEPGAAPVPAGMPAAHGQAAHPASGQAALAARPRRVRRIRVIRRR